MASESVSEKLVWAIGASGKAELCPESETHSIPMLPLGRSNAPDTIGLIIPATLRCLAKDGESVVARRLLNVTMPTDDSPYANVEYECDPFIRHSALDGHAIKVTKQGCAVCTMADARDLIFAELTPVERERLERAAAAAESLALLEAQP